MAETKAQVKSSSKAIGICMHNTANSAPATNEINYMNSNNYQVSYHLAVDENQAIQGLPFDRNGWHAGDGNGQGNRKHIGIEIARGGCRCEAVPNVWLEHEQRFGASRFCEQELSAPHEHGCVPQTRQRGVGGQTDGRGAGDGWRHIERIGWNDDDGQRRAGIGNGHGDV